MSNVFDRGYAVYKEGRKIKVLEKSGPPRVDVCRRRVLKMPHGFAAAIDKRFRRGMSLGITE